MLVTLTLLLSDGSRVYLSLCSCLVHGCALFPPRLDFVRNGIAREEELLWFLLLCHFYSQQSYTKYLGFLHLSAHKLVVLQFNSILAPTIRSYCPDSTTLRTQSHKIVQSIESQGIYFFVQLGYNFLPIILHPFRKLGRMAHRIQENTLLTLSGLL